MSDKNAIPPSDTDFGFENVPLAEKEKKVAEVFSTVAKQYDFMNDLMSFGLHRLWKWFSVQFALIQPGQRILDIAGGTADLTLRIAPLVGPTGHITLLDINNAMLNVGRNRLLDQGITETISYLQANAEDLPLPDKYFDCIIISFGLRNMTNKNKALLDCYRVLKPGGKIVILEFSTPIYESLKYLYDFYSFKVLPRLGHWITGSAKSYQYLVESIRRHPNQQRLQKLMEESGFESCEYQNLTGGIVAIHRGYRFIC